MNENIRPIVEFQRADFGNVRAQIAMNAGTFDANERAQIERGPVGVGGVAIGAPVISGQLTKRLHFRFVAVLTFRLPLLLAELTLQ